MRATITNDMGQLIGLLDADPKEFKTGKSGYFGTGKVSNNGKRYQAQIQLVEIQPKPKKKD